MSEPDSAAHPDCSRRLKSPLQWYGQPDRFSGIPDLSHLPCFRSRRIRQAAAPPPEEAKPFFAYRNPHYFVYLSPVHVYPIPGVQPADTHIFPIISDLFPFFNPNLQSVQNLQAVKRLVQETFPVKIREPFQFSEHLRTDDKGIELFYGSGRYMVNGVTRGILPFRFIR